MKYCYECGRITAGEPIFCTFCGRTYDVKLCPRLHVNPRYAEVCAQCGSRDFSTPQPKVSILWRLFAFVVKVFVGALLTYVSLVFLKELFIELLKEPYVQAGLVALGLLLITLWIAWSMLPEWIRKAIHHSMKRKKDRNRER